MALSGTSLPNSILTEKSSTTSRIRRSALTVVRFLEERHGWGDLRIDGYLKGKQVISKSLSGRGIDSKFMLLADDTSLSADGADTTRIVLRVTDEFGNIRPYANDPIVFKIDGPAELIGDNPFALIGGTGAVWVRAKEQAGRVSLTATHPRLGSQKVEIALTSAPAEMI